MATANGIIYERTGGKIVNVGFCNPPQGEGIDVGAFNPHRIQRALNSIPIPMGTVLVSKGNRLIAHVPDDVGLDFACQLEESLTGE